MQSATQRTRQICGAYLLPFLLVLSVVHVSLAEAPLAPTIYSQPLSRTVRPGINVTISVDADGYPPLSYTWRRDGLPFLAPSTNGESLRLMSTNTGDYDVVITNAFGSITSAVARLIVSAQAPTFTTEPQSRVVCSGTRVVLNALLSGTPPADYEWRRNGEILTSGVITNMQMTNSLSDLGPVTSANAGDYTLVVSNPYGAVTSSVATVTVDPPAPVITRQPKSQSTGAGGFARFTFTAANCGLMTYQWRSNGVDLPGAISNSLAFYPATSDLLAQYDVVVRSLNGASTSRTAWLVVTNWPPVLYCHPLDENVYAGSNAIFSVCASGQPPLCYLWRHNGEIISHPTNGNTFFLRSVRPEDAGAYDVVVTNASGSVTSQVAILTVLTSEPQIVMNPQSQIVEEWQSASFYVQASGAPPPAYQWRKNGFNLPGATNSWLTLASVSFADAGDYTVVADNASGSVTSAVATLTVRTRNPELPNIYGQPRSLSMLIGSHSNAFFNVVAYGIPDPTYQWFYNGQAIEEGTNAWIYVGASVAPAIRTNFWWKPDLVVTQAESNYFFVVVSNVAGAVTSAVATLTVEIPPPSIESPPQSQAVNMHWQPWVNLYVWAQGAPPLHYQWFHEGVPIPDATNSWLSFNAREVTYFPGRYVVVITNSVGSATSQVATVSVESIAPSLITTLSDWTTLNGYATSIGVIAGGTWPLWYQWQFEGADIAGATNNVYAFFATHESAGAYRVIVTNHYGSVTSAVARLTVNPRLPGFVTEPVNQGVSVGGSVRLGTVASNGFVRWQFNGQDIPGYVSVEGGYPAILWLDDVQTNQAGGYTAVVTNSDGAVTSRVATLTVSSGPLDHWHWLNPLPQGNELFDATFGNDRIVAVGERGARLVSLDGGESWQAYNQSYMDLRRVVFGNGVFVGTPAALPNEWPSRPGEWVHTSTNGIHWIRREVAVEGFVGMRDLAFGNGRFVGISQANGVITSTNGVDWIRSEWTTSWDVGRITFGNGKFLIISMSPDISGIPCAISSDGLKWFNGTIPGGGAAADLTFGNDQFILFSINWNPYLERPVPLLSTSPDAYTWATINPGLPTTAEQIAAGNGKIVAIGDPDNRGLLMTSPDGLHWWDYSYLATNELRGVALCADRFVALGKHGNLFTSTNGETWSQVSTASTVNLRGVASGNGVSVAVGNSGTVMRSSDGMSWTRQTLDASSNLRGVAFGAGLFVTVGNSPAPYSGYISSNGVDWTAQELGGGQNFYDITYGAGRFVAVGEGPAIFTSMDGLTWEAGNAITNGRLNSVTYGGGWFVAVGRAGNIATSTDGLQWTARRYSDPASESSPFLQGVAYGNGLFVAAGQNGSLLVSHNPVSLDWQSAPSPFATPSNREDIEDVIFANGRFVLVGEEGLIASSSNGLFWTRHSSGCVNNLRGAHYANNRFFAVGNNETILASDLVTDEESSPANRPTLRLLTSSALGEMLQLSVSNGTGRIFHLQASTDLVRWTNVMILTNGQAPVSLREGNTVKHPQRFFRAVGAEAGR